MKRLLIIDDEAALAKSLAMFLGEKGLKVKTAASAAEGLAVTAAWQPQVVILDVRLPDGSGLDHLAPLSEAAPRAKFIVITAHHDMETTIEAVRQGAFDYLHKPLDIDELESAVDRALHVPRQAKGGLPSPSTTPQAPRLVGKSVAMRQVFKALALLTTNRATALVQGETGTGKEVVARVIHERSPFAAEPFITVDCTTLVDNLMESELFGHEKGAFTGAAASKPGRLEMAGKGTIFFDELGELPARLQAKLLRFLERREFTRVGGHKVFYSDARIIGATNRDLEAMAEEGAFRRDLLFRFKVATIAVPPLRERPEDLDEMVPHFLERLNREMSMAITGVETGAVELLKSHAWPGNVRELINVLTKAALDSRGNLLLTESVRLALSASNQAAPKGEPFPTLAAAEKKHISQALAITNGNISAAARLLGITRPTLRGRMRKHQLGRA